MIGNKVNPNIEDIALMLSRGGIGRGSKVVMMPSFYCYREAGDAARELGAQLTFVDDDAAEDMVLQKIGREFPEFERVAADALTFCRSGIDATVHVRPEIQYVHERRVLAPGHVIGGPGYELMVRNISQWSPLHFLLSVVGYYDGDWPPQFENPAAADRAVMQQYGFRLREEGLCLDDKMRWHIFENPRLLR